MVINLDDHFISNCYHLKNAHIYACQLVSEEEKELEKNVMTVRVNNVKKTITVIENINKQCVSETDNFYDKKIDSDWIDEEEHLLGRKLPADYRYFLEYLGTQRFSSKEFYDIINEKLRNYCAMLHQHNYPRNILPDYFVPIYNAGWGGDYFIDCHDPENAPIYRWDQICRWEGDFKEDEELQEIADSFSDFFKETILTALISNGDYFITNCHNLDNASIYAQQLNFHEESDGFAKNIMAASINNVKKTITVIESINRQYADDADNFYNKKIDSGWIDEEEQLLERKFPADYRFFLEYLGTRRFFSKASYDIVNELLIDYTCTLSLAWREDVYPYDIIPNYFVPIYNGGWAGINDYFIDCRNPENAPIYKWESDERLEKIADSFGDFFKEIILQAIQNKKE